VKARIEWPDVDLRGLVSLTLTRSDLKRLIACLDSRSFGEPGVVCVDSDIVTVVTVREDA
jgi:hypothetical protein